MQRWQVSKVVWVTRTRKWKACQKRKLTWIPLKNLALEGKLGGIRGRMFWRTMGGIWPRNLASFRPDCQRNSGQTLRLPHVQLVFTSIISHLLRDVWQLICSYKDEILVIILTLISSIMMWFTLKLKLLTTWNYVHMENTS